MMTLQQYFQIKFILMLSLGIGIQSSPHSYISCTRKPILLASFHVVSVTNTVDNTVGNDANGQWNAQCQWAMATSAGSGELWMLFAWILTRLLTVSSGIRGAELETWGLSRRMTRWMEKWLDHRAQGIACSSWTSWTSEWLLVVVLRGHYWVWYYLMSWLNLDNGIGWTSTKFTEDPKLGEQSIHWRAGHWRGISTGWRNGLTETSWGSTKAIAKSWTY